MQSRGASSGQTKVADNGKLEAFWDTVLHLQDGSRGGVGYSGDPTSDSVSIGWSRGSYACPQAQVAGVPPHREEPAKPRRTIFLRVLFQKCAGLWKKEPRKAEWCARVGSPARFVYGRRAREAAGFSAIHREPQESRDVKRLRTSRSCTIAKAL